MKSKTDIPFWPESSTSHISMRPKKNNPADEKPIRFAMPYQHNHFGHQEILDQVFGDGLTWPVWAKVPYSSWLPSNTATVFLARVFFCTPLF